MAYATQDVDGPGGEHDTPRNFKKEIRQQWPRRNPDQQTIFRIGGEWIAEETCNGNPKMLSLEDLIVILSLAAEMGRLFATLKDELAGGERFSNHLEWEIEHRCRPDLS